MGNLEELAGHTRQPVETFFGRRIEDFQIMQRGDALGVHWLKQVPEAWFRLMQILELGLRTLPSYSFGNLKSTNRVCPIHPTTLRVSSV